MRYFYYPIIRENVAAHIGRLGLGIFFQENEKVINTTFFFIIELAKDFEVYKLFFSRQNNETLYMDSLEILDLYSITSTFTAKSTF